MFVLFPRVRKKAMRQFSSLPDTHTHTHTADPARLVALQSSAAQRRSEGLSRVGARSPPSGGVDAPGTRRGGIGLKNKRERDPPERYAAVALCEIDSDSFFLLTGGEASIGLLSPVIILILSGL